MGNVKREVARVSWRKRGKRKKGNSFYIPYFLLSFSSQLAADLPKRDLRNETRKRRKSKENVGNQWKTTEKKNRRPVDKEF